MMMTTGNEKKSPLLVDMTSMSGESDNNLEEEEEERGLWRPIAFAVSEAAAAAAAAPAPGGN